MGPTTVAQRHQAIPAHRCAGCAARPIFTRQRPDIGGGGSTYTSRRHWALRTNRLPIWPVSQIAVIRLRTPIAPLPESGASVGGFNTYPHQLIAERHCVCLVRDLTTKNPHKNSLLHSGDYCWFPHRVLACATLSPNRLGISHACTYALLDRLAFAIASCTPSVPSLGSVVVSLF